MAYLSASTFKHVLDQVGRSPDLELLRFGFGRGWIRASDVESLLVAGDIIGSTNDIAANVAIAMDDGPTAVQAILTNVTLSEEHQPEDIERVWWGLLLIDTLRSHEETGAALSAIAAMWADVGYPSAWESFIHYLPSAPSEPASPDDVIRRAARAADTWASSDART